MDKITMLLELINNTHEIKVYRENNLILSNNYNGELMFSLTLLSHQQTSSEKD